MTKYSDEKKTQTTFFNKEGFFMGGGRLAHAAS